MSGIIRHFDEEDRFGPLEQEEKWSVLRRNEVDLIASEIKKCREDFSYAAKNYFMITDKQGIDHPFKLWEPQEIILNKYYELRDRFKKDSRNSAVKVICIKGRQLGALDPDTPVLTADLKWKPIHDIQVEEEVIAVDEFGEVKGGRKFRTAKVLNKWWAKKESYRITFSDGRSVVASGDHQFLCKERGGSATRWVKVNDKENSLRSPIRPGDEVRLITDTWDDAKSFEDGWFAGMLDGEGCLQAKKNAGIEIGLSQVAGSVLDKAAEYLRKNGYRYRVEYDLRKAGVSSKLGNKVVYKLEIGNTPDVFRMLGSLHPKRFSGRRVWEGKKLPKNGGEKSWAKVVSVESAGVREMVDIETTEKTFIANGLVTHNCSTVVEGMIAWKTIFFPSITALVVSHTENHASYLFNIMLHIYDMLPWWLKPSIASRKQDEGLVFEKRDPDIRRKRPGNNSQVTVQAATQIHGVGQGMRLSVVHASEFSSYDDSRFDDIIHGDIRRALAENPDNFAFLESTAKGAGTPSEELWIASQRLGIDADWYPLFLPAFMETTRVLAPEKGWKPKAEEEAMRDRIRRDWLSCTNCGEYRENTIRDVNFQGDICQRCEVGTYEPHSLSDEQLKFMEHQRLNAIAIGPKALKTYKSEMCCTSQEAFQISGIQVFPQDCLEWINTTIAPPLAWGDLDDKGEFHYMKKGNDGEMRCAVDWCIADHRWDSEHPLQIWEFPQDGETYCAGVDVSEGLGTSDDKADYSLIWVNRIGRFGPDVQVAMYRSNSIDPIAFAGPINAIGRWYNDALLSIEVNRYDTTFNTVRLQYLYPNLWKWKHYDSLKMDSNKLGWYTQQNSKPRLWQTAVRWLRAHDWVVRSEEFYEEIKRFQKDDYEDRSASAETGWHDDCVMSGMIALFCAHDTDFSNDLRYIPARSKKNGVASQEWTIRCNRCGSEWTASDPRSEGCSAEDPTRPNGICGCPFVTAKRNIKETIVKGFDPEEMGRSGNTDAAGCLAYDLL